MKCHDTQTKRTVGFTLLELIIVLFIVSLLLAIVLLAGSPVRVAAHEKSCLSNLRQMGVAVKIYQSDHEGDLPLNLKALHPAYVTDSHLFRCPAWEARASTETEEIQRGVAKMFTMYAYEPEERAFWNQVPYEKGDPPSLSATWDDLYAKKGENLPLITCQFHDPLLGRQRTSDGFIQIMRLVLRMDGSVSKATLRGKRSISWSDL